jgi:hypothetical protein
MLDMRFETEKSISNGNNKKNLVAKLQGFFMKIPKTTILIGSLSHISYLISPSKNQYSV